MLLGIRADHIGAVCDVVARLYDKGLHAILYCAVSVSSTLIPTDLPKSAKLCYGSVSQQTSGCEVSTYWPSTAIMSRISTNRTANFLSLSFRFRSSSTATRKAPTATAEKNRSCNDRQVQPVLGERTLNEGMHLGDIVEDPEQRRNVVDNGTYRLSYYLCGIAVHNSLQRGCKTLYSSDVCLNDIEGIPYVV